MSTAHDQLMSDYYAAREAQEQRAEDYSAGYATELAEFYDTQETRVTFKAWLIDHKGYRYG